MYRKLIYLFSFVLVLDVAGNASADLVAHWKLDEGSGNTVYDSGTSGNDGTFESDPQWVAGYYGGALEFDGTDDNIDCGNDDSFNITDEITLSAWINMAQRPAVDDWYTIPWKENAYSMYLYGADSTVTTLCADFWLDTGRADIWDGPDIDIPPNDWTHIAVTFNGTDFEFYVNGERDHTQNQPGTIEISEINFLFTQAGSNFEGLIDDVRLYNRALTQAEILAVMEGGEEYPYALSPTPPDGAIHADTWVIISWRPGDFAASHDVYFGDNFDDVNDGTRNSDTFRGNLGLDTTYYFAGFAGGAYPEGLVNGATYYWRIDEVNEAEPNSPWKGDVWSFMVPPKTAYFPEPADCAEFVDLNVQLTWTAGLNAKVHYIVFGEDFDEVSNAVTGVPSGPASYSPGPLKFAKTYYWRVDEFDSVETHKGEVWSFTTEGAVSGPNPADGAVDVKPSVILGWDAGAVAASHDVYFGADADAVANATTASSEYKGAKALGEESYDPGKLTLNMTYYWRIDEVNGVNPDSPWAGNVWSFTTGDFFVIDDFESYDANDNQIWYSWHDGLGYGTPGTDPYFAGNGTGAAVGDETTASYTEETIVNGGLQSMPLSYDNNKQGYAYYSEVEKTMSDTRDWTEEGVAELSLWFRGNPASVGSFVEGPVGTYTMTATGADIWNDADEFHFASKILSGPGSIIARVESVEQTDPWAKAGVMIRETLDAGSKFAAVYIMPTNADGTATNGCRFQARLDADAAATSDSGVTTAEQTAIIAPYWVKLERDVGGNFRGYYSSNGSTWQSMSWNPQSISMSSNVYVGLALTSHNASATCQAKFSNVTITDTVGPHWANQDIGIESNAAEPLYVAVSNSAGAPAVVVHDDPAAAQIDTWTEWVIPLQALADQGIVPTNVDRIAIGLGTQGNTTIPGGSGKMFFDDIRLYQPRTAPDE